MSAGTEAQHALGDPVSVMAQLPVPVGQGRVLLTKHLRADGKASHSSRPAGMTQTTLLAHWMTAPAKTCLA